MYFVTESPKILNIPISDVSQVKYVKTNKDNMFLCAITSNEIMIWLTTVRTCFNLFCFQNDNSFWLFVRLNEKTNMLLAFHQRASNSVSIHGENHLVEWNTDSSKIVVLTTKGYLIYYKITFENEYVLSDISFAQNSWFVQLIAEKIIEFFINKSLFSRNDSVGFSNRIQFQNPLLRCKIAHDFSIHIQNAYKSYINFFQIEIKINVNIILKILLILSLSCYNDEIYVPLFNGKVIKVPWNDRTRTDHFFLLLQKIYFQYETEGESKKPVN